MSACRSGVQCNVSHDQPGSDSGIITAELQRAHTAIITSTKYSIAWIAAQTCIHLRSTDSAFITGINEYLSQPANTKGLRKALIEAVATLAEHTAQAPTTTPQVTTGTSPAGPPASLATLAPAATAACNPAGCIQSQASAVTETAAVGDGATDAADAPAVVAPAPTLAPTEMEIAEEAQENADDADVDASDAVCA